MKAFDLEAAKRGEMICTRDGRLAMFIAHNIDAPEYERIRFEVKGFHSEVLCNEKGIAAGISGESVWDLFMVDMVDMTPGKIELLYDDLTFNHLSEINLARSMRWHKDKSWSIDRWAIAMGGEAGEVLNAVKKLNRILDGLGGNNNPESEDSAREHIAKEIGDTVLYADLLAQRCGFTLEECIRMVFNTVSEREGFPERL